MKPSSRLSSTPSRLSDSAHHQLNMYALAASAAGVGMLALTQAAEAEIVYTRANESITPNHSYPLDLTHDGTVDFRFKDTHITSSPYGFDHTGILSVRPAVHANKVVGFSRDTRHYASALDPGVSIGPKKQFTLGPRLMATAFSDTGAHPELSNQCNGPWSGAKNRYLGLEFLIKGKVHFGWARLNVTCPGTDVDATLTGYAYETIPNKPIITGKEHGADDSTVQPASLGRLAAGATAIPAWRTTGGNK